MKVDLIYTDPPWDYESNSKKNPGRNVRKEYPTMSVDEMKEFVVSPFGKTNSMMAMWVTGPFLDKYPELMRAWGYKPKSILFTWVKVNKNFSDKFTNAFVDIFSSTNIANILEGDELINANKMAELIKEIKISPEELFELLNLSFKMGMGYHTRANAEICVYGTKGSGIGEPALHNIKEVIVSVPRPQHSAKPIEAYEKLEALYPNATKLEMFARERRKGWYIWGNDENIISDIEIKRQKKVEHYFKQLQ